MSSFKEEFMSLNIFLKEIHLRSSEALNSNNQLSTRWELKIIVSFGATKFLAFIVNTLSRF